MIKHELLKDKGILVVTPEGKLEAADFEGLAKEMDEYFAKSGELKGLLIYTPSFPGWKDFSALVTHLQFIKNHQKQIKKIAAVTEPSFLDVLPKVVQYFVHAELKHFNYEDKDAALAWLAE